MGSPRESQRSRGIKEVRGPRARETREVRREGAHARRALSDPRGLGEIQPLRRHRVPDLRAGRRLLLFAGVQGGGGVSPQEQGGRERARDDRGGRRRAEVSCPHPPTAFAPSPPCRGGVGGGPHLWDNSSL